MDTTIKYYTQKDISVSFKNKPQQYQKKTSKNIFLKYWGEGSPEIVKE